MILDPTLFRKIKNTKKIIINPVTFVSKTKYENGKTTPRYFQNTKNNKTTMSLRQKLKMFNIDRKCHSYDSEMYPCIPCLYLLNLLIQSKCVRSHILIHTFSSHTYVKSSRCSRNSKLKLDSCSVSQSHKLSP